MKKYIPIAILALATSALALPVEEGNPNPAEAPAPVVVAQAPAAPAAPPAPVEPAPAAGAAAPLIVIDDVPLTDAIRNLARQSNLNFQFDPRVVATNQPNISIRFENVTAEEALLAVLENYNLQLARDTKSKIARVTVKDPKAEEPMVTEIVQLKYCEATNMVAMIKPSLPPKSQVLADPRTGQIIVTTHEKEMDRAKRTIEQLDTPTKQVLIEGRIWETTKNPSTIKGIDWSGTLQKQQFSMGNNRQLGPVPMDSENPPLATAYPKVIASAAKGSFFNPAMAFMNADGVSAVFSFLNTDADTELVATPRAVTLDNQMAQLSVTRAFPIFTVTPGSANSPAGSQVTYTNLGVMLSVIPRIAADNNISLRVVPEVSAKGPTDKQTLEGKSYEANTFDIRRIETHVMIPSGHTLVMGGLNNNTMNNGYTKVPILGDIPGLGFFFKSESKQREKRTMLVFITPTVVEDAAFQMTSSGNDFLNNTKMVEATDKPLSAWDSAKPHDWTQPVY